MGEQFFSRVESYIPNLEKYLNKGATEEEIHRLELETGYIFPEAFKSIYSVHNGEKKLGFMFGLTWHSIGEMLSEWKGYKTYYEESVIDVISFEKGAIQEAAFHPGWIPIAYDYGGNYLAMDFAPGVNGTVGQIINFGRDERQMYVISDSFEELLELLIQQFEVGNCSLIEEEDGPYVIWGDYGHFFDDLKKRPYKGSMGGEEDTLELDESWTTFLTAKLGHSSIKEHELGNITTLRLFPSNITDLRPLAYFPNVRELIASTLEIIDFTPIAQLQNLKSLYLAKTPLSDLGFLRKLQELKQLSIGNTKVTDISVLAELPLLQELSLENLTIEDLTPLTFCKKLSHLNLSGIKTKSIEEINGVRNLCSLDITKVELNNLDFLKGMTKIEDLRIEVMDDYSALKGLQNLQSLTCPYDAFLATKDLFEKRINYTIMGEMNEEQEDIYSHYALGR